MLMKVGRVGGSCPAKRAMCCELVDLKGSAGPRDPPGHRWSAGVPRPVLY